MTDKRLTCEELRAMQEVDVRTVDREALQDIRDVEINTGFPRENVFWTSSGRSGTHTATGTATIL